MRIHCAPAAECKSIREKRGQNAHTVSMVTWDVATRPVLSMQAACVNGIARAPGTAVDLISRVQERGGTAHGPALRRASADADTTDVRAGVWQVDNTGIQWCFAYVQREPNARSPSSRSREWRVRMPMLEDIATDEFVRTGRIRVVVSRVRYGTAMRAAIVADNLQRLHARRQCFVNFAVSGEWQVVRMRGENRPELLSYWLTEDVQRRLAHTVPRPDPPTPVDAVALPCAVGDAAADGPTGPAGVARAALESVLETAVPVQDCAGSDTASSARAAHDAPHAAEAPPPRALSTPESSDDDMPRGYDELYDPVYCDVPLMPFDDVAPNPL